VHIVGPMASELIAECVVAMAFRASSEDIARICHAHPSLSESTKEAALAVDKSVAELLTTAVAWRSSRAEPRR
jgi:dihydrolipoamide dehydrogenase